VHYMKPCCLLHSNTDNLYLVCINEDMISEMHRPPSNNRWNVVDKPALERKMTHTRVMDEMNDIDDDTFLAMAQHVLLSSRRNAE